MPAHPKQRKIAIVGSRAVGRLCAPRRRVATRAHDSPAVNSAAGKSSLTVQFVEGHFVESYYPTIENTFSQVIKYKGQEFATEIVDTAGQVRAKLARRSSGALRSGQGPDRVYACSRMITAN